MAISDTQKVDYLFKKVGYGVAKTDTSTVKSPSNESIASPLLIRGDSIWQESASIPSTIPSSNSSVVSVYSDALHSTVPTTNDATASTNRTWKTGLTDWIDSSFGSTYQVKVYVAPTGNSSPQTYGTQLFADGTGSDEWFFDYQSGVLNFIGTNLPSVSFTGNTVYVSGARYAGIKGISTISNINFSNTTISATGTNANLNINANGSGYVNTGNITATGLVLRSNSYISFGNSLLSNIANPINSQDAVTLSYLTSQLGLFGGTISSDNSSVSVIDSGSNGRVEITVDGFLIGNINSNTTSLYNTVNLGNLSINSETISSTGNIILNALGAGIVKILGSDAIGLPYGNIVARPLNPDVGYLRYNTDLYNIEFWDGSDWINSHQQVTSQNLSPNGLANSFSLTTSTTTTGVIVTINGVVQQPTLAYSVTGNVITFTETPISTDAIEVRTLATGVANVVATSMSGDNASVTFTSGNVEIVGNINVSKNAVIIGNVIANDFIYSNGVSILNALYSNAASQASNIADLYSNAASQASNIADLYSNAASQSGYINSANTAMKGYVDGQISTTNTSITTANTAMKGYVDAVTTAWQANAAVQAGDIATLYANAAVQSGAIVTANTAMKGYVDAVTTAWQANAAVQAGDIATLYANAAVQAGDIATLYANAGAQSGAIVTANTAMKGYVDAVTTAWQSNAGAQSGSISYLQTNYANLVTSTAQTFTGNITVPYASVTSLTNATAYNNGALVVSGGLGVAKDVYIQGNLYVANIFNTYSNIITVEVPLLYLEANGDELTYTPYNYDIGVYSHYWGGPANTYVHTGFIRNDANGTWYLFSNVAEPSSGQVAFDSNTLYDPIITGTHTVYGNIVANTFTYANGISILSDLYANAAVQAGDIATLYANAGAQSGAIVTANTAMKGYVDGQISTTNTSITTANTAMKGYVDGQISTTNTSITTANTAMKGYVDAVTTAWQANAAVQSGDIATLYANAAVQSGDIATLYANAAVQAGDIATLYANAGVQSGAIVTANTAMKGYVDGQISTTNTSITTANTAMKGYVDAVTTAWQSNAGAQSGSISYLQTNYANLVTSTAQTFTSNITIPNLSVSGSITQTSTVASAITSVLTHGADNNFQLTSQNGSASNASGQETARFGINYSGVGWDTYIQYIRGGGAQSGWMNFFASNTSIVTLNSSGITLNSGSISINGNPSTAIANGGSAGTGNIGASGAGFNTVFAKATSAQYADLAENYIADTNYEPGTVLQFGGNNEVTIAENETIRIAGVVSTNPAYLMNSELTGNNVVSIALQGRVPVKVIGPVEKGDMLTSAGNGYAKSAINPKLGTIIGKSLNNFNGEIGIIEVVVGRL